MNHRRLINLYLTVLKRFRHPIVAFASALQTGYLPRGTLIAILAAAAILAALALLAIRSRLKKARQAEEGFHVLVDNIHQIVWIADLAQRRLTYTSPAFERIWGVSPAPLFRNLSSFLDFVHPDDKERLGQIYQESLTAGRWSEVEFRIVRPDGSIRWLHSRVLSCAEKAGKPTRQVGVAEDVTERLQAECTLRQSEQLFRTMFEAAPIAMAFGKPDLRISRVNPAVRKLLGREEAEILGRSFVDFTHPDDAPLEVAQERKLIAAEISGYSVQKRFVRPDGEIVWASIATVAVRDPDGALMHLLKMAVDITDQKRAEAGLRDLTARLLTLQDEERRRIARELHDSLGQDLAAMRFALAQLSSAQLPADLAGIVAECDTSAKKMLLETRTLSYLLHPPLLDELGLLAALRLYLEGFGQRSGIELEYVFPERLPRLSHELELSIFRIVQEAVTNVHRHSGSIWCQVAIGHTDGTISVEVRDRGKGLPCDLLAGFSDVVEHVGVGISGMRERARSLGGKLRFEPGDPGCILVTEFPVGEE